MNGRQVGLVSRFDLGHGTNNEAEFESLIKALDWTLEKLDAAGLSSELYSLAIFTDSMIVRNRIVGRYKSNNRMGKLCKVAMDRIKMFTGHRIEWNSRDNNVEKFGH